MARIFIAGDHAGFGLKQALIPYIGSLGHEVEDIGAPELSPGDDYPDYVTPCAEKVTGEPGSFGIVIGGSGQGEAMCANRIKGIRAAVYYGPAPKAQMDADGTTLDIIESERAHNDANILSLGARFLSDDDAKDAVRRFLATPFSGEERHQRRLAKF